MTKRAEKAMCGLYNSKTNPAIAALVEFAAQNSGIESANYFQSWQDRSGIRAYRSETRDIGNDWKRFREALAIAAMEGVKDEHVIKEAPHAFSGRLEWKTTRTVWEGEAPNCTSREVAAPGHWDYCTGQYFPTEYRKAAATLLEYATRLVRQAREPVKGAPVSIAALKHLNELNGGCWFEKSSMRFFGTRIESGIINGRYFITSEQQDEGRPRKFSIRTFDDEGSVDTVGEFHSHDTKRDALEALNEHLNTQPVTA